MFDSFKHLGIRVDGSIVFLTLGDGSKLNAVDVESHAELPMFFRAFQLEDSLSAAVVTGASQKNGRGAFSIGGDLDLLQQMHENDHIRQRVFRDAAELVRSLIDLDKPLISAVNGYAMGAGAVVALFSDFIYMEQSALVSDGHVRAAIAAGDGGTITWPLAMGVVKAKQYLLTGDFIDATEAERLGLITAAVADGGSLEAATATAQRLANGPQPAIRATKRAIHAHMRNAYNLGFEQALLAEEFNVVSEEARIAIENLSRKRK